MVACEFSLASLSFSFIGRDDHTSTLSCEKLATSLEKAIFSEFNFNLNFKQASTKYKNQV